MAAPVVHFELWSENPEALSKFYREVFGWDIREVSELNYYLVDKARDDGIGGGIMKPKRGDWPGNMAFYMDVDDLAAYARKITEAGGRMIVEEQEVPGVGHLSLFADPEGRVLGMWKQGGGGQ